MFPKRPIIFLSLLVFLFIAVFVLVTIPTIKTIKNLSREIYGIWFNLEKKYELGQTLKKTVADLKIVEQKKNQLLNVFLEKNQELTFITTLENIAEQFNLQQEINLEKEENNKNSLVVNLPFRFTVKGNFQDIIRYLSKIT